MKMNMIIKKQITENLQRCPHFDKCSQNLCPLDLELNLRSGNTSDKCRWMREPKQTKLGDKEFISGGRVMPNAILNFVSEDNLKWLNGISQKAWQLLKNNSKT